MYNYAPNNMSFNNPMSYNAPYSPYDMPRTYSQVQGSSLVRVNGIEGAKAYQMGANSTVALFDANEDIFYAKSTDGAGFATIRAFKFEELKDGTPTEKEDYVSRKEMEEYVKQFISKSNEQTRTVNATSKSAKAE